MIEITTVETTSRLAPRRATEVFYFTGPGLPNRERTAHALFCYVDGTKVFGPDRLQLAVPGDAVTLRVGDEVVVDGVHHLVAAEPGYDPHLEEIIEFNYL